jgi:Spy/CpxP family protein refolding chaperone
LTLRSCQIFAQRHHGAKEQRFHRRDGRLHRFRDFPVGQVLVLSHNTDFVTIVSFNVLHILTEEQLQLLVARAGTQVSQINQYAYARFPLLKAFRRLVDGDLPDGATGFDQAAVLAASAELYRIDGEISYDRAELLGGIIRSLTLEQKAALDRPKGLGGVGNWDCALADPMDGLQLERDVKVAVMTYASEMYAWYAGSVEADVYFCPERQGTYFGSFYLKDWPAMGNPDFTIDERLTARAGEEFLAALTDSQATVMTGLVDLQRAALYEIVQRREDIATQLRRFMTEASIDSAAVMELSDRYGELDGEIVYYYATRMAAVSQALSAAQRADVTALADSLGYLPPPGGVPLLPAHPNAGDHEHRFSVHGVGCGRRRRRVGSPRTGKRRQSRGRTQPHGR